MPGCQIVTNMEEVSECLAYRDTGQKPPEYITLTSPTFTNNPYILHTPFAALRYIYIYLDMYTLCCIQTNDVWKLDGRRVGNRKVPCKRHPFAKTIL